MGELIVWIVIIWLLWQLLKAFVQASQPHAPKGSDISSFDEQKYRKNSQGNERTQAVNKANSEIRPEKVTPRNKKKEANRLSELSQDRKTKHPRLNTGIFELDGPGVWHRLHQYPSGHVLYLLFSENHNAYKVGVSEPERLGHRIKMIREEIPDVILDGLAVFTSRQNAFDKEQEVLNRYRSKQYLGIKGRYAGGTEWISVRPTGKPYFTPPSRIEEMFRESIEAPAQELDIPDLYTVYLLYSKSKNMYLSSWCNTKNLPEKIRRAQNIYSSDAELLARFKVESKSKARAITIANNKMANSFRKEGRHEIFGWCEEPEYLYLFDKWDKNGQKK